MVSEEQAPRTQSRRTHSLAAEHVKFGLSALFATCVWTSLGAVLSYSCCDLRHFLEGWQRYQAFPALALATWLMLLARSGIFKKRVEQLMQDAGTSPPGLRYRGLRAALVTLIFILAASTSIGMGFDASWPLIAFYWATAVIAGLLAGIVMVHTIHTILTIHQLQNTSVKSFHYAPARTPELKDIVSYFATFALILSIAYFFAFLGTTQGKWLGNPTFIKAVQLFWPIVYVPVCSATLLYPHYVVHRIIHREKERTVLSYQQEIENIIVDYHTLDNEEVQRVNALAQFLDRVIATPNYVVDFGVTLKTLTPLALNIAMVVGKPMLIKITGQ